MFSDPPARPLLVCVNLVVECDSKRNCTLLWVILPAEKTIYVALGGNDTYLVTWGCVKCLLARHNA